jgi:hypothetical protein
MNKIIARKPVATELGTWISGELGRLSAVDRRVIYNRTRRDEAKREFDARIKKLDEESIEIREACPHYSTTHHPDPSGGSDSYSQCDHCGKEW